MLAYFTIAKSKSEAFKNARAWNHLPESLPLEARKISDNYGMKLYRVEVPEPKGR